MSKFSMEKIEKNDYSLNFSKYVSAAKKELKIELKEVNYQLETIKKRIQSSTYEHNKFLKKLENKTIYIFRSLESL